MNIFPTSLELLVDHFKENPARLSAADLRRLVLNPHLLTRAELADLKQRLAEK